MKNNTTIEEQRREIQAYAIQIASGLLAGGHFTYNGPEGPGWDACLIPKTVDIMEALFKQVTPINDPRPS